MSVQTPSVHTAVLWIQHPAPQAGREIGWCLAPLLGLRAAVRGEKGKGGAGGDRIVAAGVLFPQILGDDAVQGGWGGNVELQLFFHSWSLIKRKGDEAVSSSSSWL